MKRACGLVALILMLGSAAHGATQDASGGASRSASGRASLTAPIARAGSGQLQCYTPNVTAKTCLSIAAYAVDPAGVIQNTAFLLVSPDPLIVMTTVSPVTIEHGQVCGSISQQDLSAAHFTVAGQAASADQETKLRQLIIQAMGKYFGHDLCTAYVPDGDSLIAKVTDNGVPQPQGEQKVIWVAPTEGYKVAP